MSDLAGNLERTIKEFAQTLHSFAEETKITTKDTHLMSGMLFIILAKLDHLIFKNNAYTALTDKKTDKQFDNHHDCRFGRWYENKGKELMGKTKSYGLIAPHHKAVHDSVTKNIVFIEKGKDRVAANLDEIIKNFQAIENSSNLLFSTIGNMFTEYKEELYKHHDENENKKGRR